MELYKIFWSQNHKLICLFLPYKWFGIYSPLFLKIFGARIFKNVQRFRLKSSMCH